MRAAEESKSRSLAGTASRSSNFSGRVRHEWQRQNGDLTQHFRGDIEHRALPRRIGLRERPRRLAGKIAIGLGDDGPDRVKHVVELMVAMASRALPIIASAAARIA